MPRIANSDELKDLAFVESHFVQMMFYPGAWVNSQSSTRAWINVDFPPNPRSGIPAESGVYAFVVEPNLFSLAPASGLFYIGKATNLYQRIGAYIGELNKAFSSSKRPHIWKMLNQWNGHFKYYYTTTSNVSMAEDLEEEMLKAFRPPYNKQYDAETSQTMRAFP
ncbi:MAG: GIY-YIG nuclease family protein [Colwellia sp.]